MPRIDNKRYQRQVALTMAIYMIALLGGGALLKTTVSLPLKALLAVAPVLPMLYVIVLVARKIRDSDELEQRTHLVALGVSTAVVSGLSLLGGFLAAAGVLRVGGAVLMLVFPALTLVYALTRKWVARRYGSDAVCDEEGSVWMPLYFAGTSLLLAALALHAWWHQLSRAMDIYAWGAGIFALMAAWAWRRQLRARRRTDKE
ncbi:hypothetical protein [Dyella sp. A6]|uniref:hypothetical protein n=1 Tax=Dyella aluminiiresistens TaxID=3069105 RepID=UPI002E7906E8|nr:hypothetical protein [Dyella sp. A6]